MRVSRRQLTELVVAAVRSPKFDFYGAIATMSVALIWKLGQALTADPQILVDGPVVLAFVFYLSLLFAAVGAIGFVVAQGIIMWLRWCLREKISPGRAWTAVVSAALGLIFFGLPDLCDGYSPIQTRRPRERLPGEIFPLGAQSFRPPCPCRHPRV